MYADTPTLELPLASASRICHPIGVSSAATSPVPERALFRQESARFFAPKNGAQNDKMQAGLANRKYSKTALKQASSALFFFNNYSSSSSTRIRPTNVPQLASRVRTPPGMYSVANQMLSSSTTAAAV